MVYKGKPLNYALLIQGIYQIASLYWNFIKRQIHTEAISYSIKKSKECSYYLASMSAKLCMLQDQISGNFIKEFEKPTKYFLSLEKLNHQVKHIWSLMHNYELIFNPKAILYLQADYYSKLYSETLTIRTKIGD